MNANLDLWLGVIVFGSPIFLMDRIVGLDGYSGKWLAALRNSISNGKIVTHVREQRQYHDGGSNTEEYAFQSFLFRAVVDDDALANGLEEIRHVSVVGRWSLVFDQAPLNPRGRAAGHLRLASDLRPTTVSCTNAGPRLGDRRYPSLD